MKNFIYFAFTFFITLIIIDIYLQVSEISSHTVTENNDIIGSSLKKNEPLIFFNEGFYLGKTNKYGFLGPSYSKKKDSSIVRIALLGDSYVEARQLFDRNSYRRLIELKLSELTGKKIEVMNFGRSGFDLADMYCYYINLVKDFNPDFILFFLSNEDFTIKQQSNRMPICYLENDLLKIDYSFRDNRNFKFRKKMEWVGNNSLVGFWIFKIKKIIDGELLWPILFDKFYTFFNDKMDLKNNSHNKIKRIELTKIIKKIILELKKRENFYIVEEKPLANNIQNYLTKNNLQIIKLDSLDAAKYHYWPVTKKIGHWNFEAHHKIAKIITTSLASVINRNN